MASRLAVVIDEIEQAIQAGIWRDPGPERLRRILGPAYDLGDLTLFETIEHMERVTRELECYASQAAFCMRISSMSGGPSDPRLTLDRALIVAGSRMPGDDVFVAVDPDERGEGAGVLVFDWNSPVPYRWKRVMSLRTFVSRLAGASA